MKMLSRLAVVVVLLCNITAVSSSNAHSDKFIEALEYFETYSRTQWSDYDALPESGYWGSVSRVSVRDCLRGSRRTMVSVR